MWKGLIGILLFVSTGCASNWNLANLSLFNTNSTIKNQNEVEQEAMDAAGATILSVEEKKRAKKIYDEWYEKAKTIDLEVLLSRDDLHYVAAGKRDWPGWGSPNISFIDYIEENPKAKEATDDLRFLLWQIYKVHPTFVLNECSRSNARQAKVRKKGLSQLGPGKSKHNQIPAQACDVVSIRKNNKKDFRDVDALAAYQGIAVGLSVTLNTMPCEVFGSKVTRVIDWKTIRDLYHIEAVPRPECKGLVIIRPQVKLKFNKVAAVYIGWEPVIPWGDAEWKRYRDIKLRLRRSYAERNRNS